MRSRGLELCDILSAIALSRIMRYIKCDRPYENMNITGVKGLTDAEITTLKA
jgi:hypothetical protein